MFKDDVTAALVAQTAAIAALAARVPPIVDPATIVPLADQQSVVAGIVANTVTISATDAAPAVVPSPVA